jgi:hypothetical protein
LSCGNLIGAWSNSNTAIAKLDCGLVASEQLEVKDHKEQQADGEGDCENATE